ncbi:MAG: cupin domain-containing protein [Bacteroidetes bacterium]|nr:cupin domain-containing protein [Bacteroidota bacterium]
MLLAQPYGSIEWLVNGELGNAAELSVARMIIAPGATSASHSHSNCEEAAYVIRGAVEEVIGDEVFGMVAGQCAVAPRGIPHYFRNVGSADAEVLLFFSSAHRAYEQHD